MARCFISTLVTPRQFDSHFFFDEVQHRILWFCGPLTLFERNI